MVIIVPGRPVSWNAIYSQNSYWRRKSIVDGIHENVHASLMEMGIFPNKEKNLFKKKVKAHYKAYFKNRLQDVSNVCEKVYEDALKGFVLVDDAPEYVGLISKESFMGTPERLEIEIEEM